MLVQQTGRIVALKSCASSHGVFGWYNFESRWCSVVWQHAYRRLLRCVVAAVKHYKANTTLKKLYLENNKVENEGAAALAKAVKATVLTCGSELCVPGSHKCCFVVQCDELAFPSFCAVCGAAILQLPVT